MFILNKTILNVISNFIRHETVTVDELPWFTKEIKNLIQEKSNVFKAIKIVKTMITCNT